MTELELFEAALERPSLERPAFLDEACAGNPPLRKRLEALLARHQRAGSFLEMPAAEVNVTSDPPAAQRQGLMIAGRYKLLEQIGEGGMGTVWVAEQTEPVKRRVALKLIKPGMDTRQVLSRFEAERQALALMDHPNIARVFDGGMTDEGRPFFVMEYVKGLPLTQYCDDTRLTVAERLALFTQVCQAVQHAHQKGIIHRDLKPSNILVCLYDGQPVPKVIDFGLAKAISQPLTEHTLYTAHGLMVGTPLYMSPEQAEFNNLDIDTRSDIYSLGVILYELLTGTTPLEKRQFKDAALQEMLRLIKEEEPPRPSIRLSGSGSLPSLAAQRGLDPAKLTKTVRGELDWIVMKALEKDRARRYETANGLARDIQHHLSDEPVEACPPSAFYRLRKLLRKHRTGVLTATALLAVLVLGIVGSTWQAVRATRAEREALLAREQESRQRQQMEEQRNRAVEAERVARSNEQKALAEEIKVRESVLDVMTLLQAFQNQVADVTVAYKAAGKLDQAVSFYEQSAEAVKAHSGPQHNSAYVSLANRAVAYQAAGKVNEAIALLEQMVPVLKAGPGPTHPTTLSVMTRLAELYNDLRQADRAIPLFEQAVPGWTALLGPTDDFTLTTMNNLGFAYMTAGNLDKAVPLLEQVFMARETKYGRNHAHTLTSMKNLAAAYREAKRFDDAVKLFEETVRITKAMFGTDHSETVEAMRPLGFVYQQAGRLADSIAHREALLPLMKAKYGPDHQETLVLMNNLTDAYRTAGRLPEAISLGTETLPLTIAKYGADDLRSVQAMMYLAWAYRDSKRPSEAIPLWEEMFRVRKDKLGPDDINTINVMRNLGVAYRQVGRMADSIAIREQTLSLLKPKLGAENSETLTFMSNLGADYLQSGEYAKAEPLFLTVYQGMKQAREADSQARASRTEILQRLVQLYDAWGKPDEVAKWGEVQAASDSPPGGATKNP